MYGEQRLHLCTYLVKRQWRPIAWLQSFMQLCNHRVTEIARLSQPRYPVLCAIPVIYSAAQGHLFYPWHWGLQSQAMYTQSSTITKLTSIAPVRSSTARWRGPSHAAGADLRTNCSSFSAAWVGGVKTPGREGHGSHRLCCETAHVSATSNCTDPPKSSSALRSSSPKSAGAAARGTRRRRTMWEEAHGKHHTKNSEAAMCKTVSNSGPVQQNTFETSTKKDHAPKKILPHYCNEQWV